MPNMQKSRIFIIAVVVCLGAAGASAAEWGHANLQDYQVSIEGVEIWPGVEVDLQVTVFVNQNVPCQSPKRTVLAIHGLTHTAASWQPFAEQLFEKHQGPVPCRVVAVDLPGRGGSGVPDVPGEPLYGDMLLDDFVTVLLQAMDRLPALGLRSTSIVAHSQGALLVQMAQQRLIESGATLRSEHGITRALFLAASPPADLPWFFATIAFGFFEPFLVLDPQLGLVIAIPDDAWPFFYFTNLAGTPVSNFPSPAEVATYNAIEPTASSAQLIGLTDEEGNVLVPRPVVAPGIFADPYGTELFMVVGEQDVLINWQENAVLYGFLTGDTELERFVVAPGPEAVHGLHISDPAAVVAALGELYPAFTRGH
jgi:pimeloyl-ACP methyl ester carboxylesterase